MNHSPGRPSTTGKYKTRKELEEAIFRDYHLNKMTLTQAANASHVSLSVVSRLIHSGLKHRYPIDLEDPY
jgi:hypothetical protein